METNDLGFVASLLFVLVPAVFLIILYIQTNSRQGGASASLQAPAPATQGLGRERGCSR